MSSIKKVRVGKKKRKNLTKHYSDAVLFAMEYLKKNDDDKNDDEKVSNHDDNNLMYWNEEEDSELLVHMNEETEFCKDEVSEYVEFKVLKHLQKDLPPREISDFSILKHQDAFYRNIHSSRNHFDDHEPLHKNLSCTKGEFARGSLELFQQCNMTKQNQKSFWNFLSNTLGSVINLPVRKQLKKKRTDVHEPNENLFADTTVEMTDDYCKQEKMNRFLEFCQCENDCTIYVGEIKNKLFECPDCSYPRFRPCTRGDCTNNGSHNCEHLLYEDGISYKTVLYRPLIHLIYELLETEYFECYLNYERFHKNDQEYRCFMDGEAAKGHLKDMEKYADTWKMKKSNRQDVTCVNFLLSQFYDSGQLFTSKSFDFWPLCIGILNLPPTLCGKVGLGYFLGALYNGKHSPVEKTLFSDFLCEELRCLYNGIEHVFTDCRGQKKVYFIQARLIMHILDTKAAEPIMGFQACQNSKFGCPLCHGITGLHDGKKCVFFGHRNFLPKFHFLRFFGQTGYCCARGFYNHDNEENQWRKKEKFWNLEKGFKQHLEPFFFTKSGSHRSSGYDIFDDFKRFMSKKQPKKGIPLGAAARSEFISKNASELEDICQPCDGNLSRKNDLVEFLLHYPTNEPPPFTWFHEGEFSLNNIREHFTNNMWFRHQDFREQRPYKRKSYSHYISSALEALTLNYDRTTQKKSHVNGIQRPWYFASLPYADLSTQFTWPFAHAVTGFIVRIVKLIIGKYEDSTKAKLSRKKREPVVISNDAKATKTQNPPDDDDDDDDDAADDDNVRFDPYDTHKFRPTYSDSQIPPYGASKDCIEKLSTWLNCVLLPVGLDDSFKINFTKPSSMKIVQKLKMLSSFWDLIMDTLDIKPEYKLLYRMIAGDINLMLSYTIRKDKVDNLQNCTTESISSWEGMIPPKENYFQIHQIVDLPGFIHLFGPPMGVSELPGERMLSMLKKRKLRVNSGGVSFGPYIFRNQMNFESWKAQKFFNTMPTHLNRRTNKYVYNDRPFYIHSNEAENRNKMPTLSDYEFEFLIDEMVLQINRVSKSCDRSCDGTVVSILLRILNHPDILSKRNLNRSYKSVFSYVVWNEQSFEKEFVHFSRKILNFRPRWQKQAIIYGIPFGSRGSDCREVEKPISHEVYYKYNPSNTKSKWHHKSDISCWFKYDKNTYGKLNSFFTVDELGDEAMNGLLLASVTCFNIDIEKRRNVDRVSHQYSLKEIYFVALQDIIPSRVATIPFNENDQTISLTKNKRYKLFTKNKFLIHQFHCPIPKYYSMILLDRNKLSFFCDDENDRPFTKYC